MSLPVDSPTRNSDQGSNRRKGKRSTREKIEKLVADGAKNYPAYLKLIYTGDSEQSSEEENVLDVKVKVEVVQPTDVADSAWESAASECGGSPRIAPRSEKVLSPESDKLLDPGKEKPLTPTDGGAPGAVVKIPPNTATEEISSELDNRKVCNEEQHDDNQRSNEEKWKIELFQLQDDIVSLKSMLNGKLQIAADLKQKLGITPIVQFKYSFFSFKESSTFLRTNAVLKSLGAFATRKMGTIRNSVVFKSVEEKVVKVKSKSMTHIKTKLHRNLSGSKSESNVSDLKSKDRQSNSITEEEEVMTPNSPTSPEMMTH